MVKTEVGAGKNLATTADADQKAAGALLLLSAAAVFGNLVKSWV